MKRPASPGHARRIDELTRQAETLRRMGLHGFAHVIDALIYDQLQKHGPIVEPRRSTKGVFNAYRQ